MQYPYGSSHHDRRQQGTSETAPSSRSARKQRMSPWTLPDMPPMTRVGKPDLVR